MKIINYDVNSPPEHLSLRDIVNENYLGWFRYVNWDQYKNHWGLITEETLVIFGPSKVEVSNKCGISPNIVVRKCSAPSSIQINE